MKNEKTGSNRRMSRIVDLITVVKDKYYVLEEVGIAWG